MEKLYRVCGRCNGLGYVPSPSGGAPLEDPCVTCLGEKYVESGETIDLSVADDQAEAAIAALAAKVDDLTDTINDIYDKCNDIFEAVTG